MFENEASHDALSTVVRPAVERFVRTRVADRHAADDVVQSTLAKVMEHAPEIAIDVLVPYAIASARNAIISRDRHLKRSESLLPRLFDPSQRESDNSADVVLQSEEYAAMRSALQELQKDERNILLRHHVQNTPLSAIADDQPANAVGVKLARYRAKLRLEYLLAYRRIDLPSRECRSVLMSLSSADLRRQSALRAGDHLDACATCASLAPPLIERHRGLAVLLPMGLIASIGPTRPVKFVRSHTMLSGGTAVAAGIVAFAVTTQGPTPQPSAPTDECKGVIVVGGESLSNVSMPSVADGVLADVRNALVTAVPANEGFWIRCGQRTAWVQLTSPGESLAKVRAGQQVSFTGTVVRHKPNFADDVGVDPSEGGAELTASGTHLEVPANAVATVG